MVISIHWFRQLFQEEIIQMLSISIGINWRFKVGRAWSAGAFCVDGFAPVDDDTMGTRAKRGFALELFDSSLTRSSPAHARKRRALSPYQHVPWGSFSCFIFIVSIYLWAIIKTRFTDKREWSDSSIRILVTNDLHHLYRFEYLINWLRPVSGYIYFSFVTLLVFW